MQLCDVCRFFRLNPPADKPNAVSFGGGEIRGGGECRRRAPVRLARDENTVARFPIVYCSYWCGEFEPRGPVEA